MMRIRSFRPRPCSRAVEINFSAASVTDDNAGPADDDACPAAASELEDSVVAQLSVGSEHRVAVDGQRGGEFGCGRQLLADRQLSGRNAAANAACDLVLEALS